MFKLDLPFPPSVNTYWRHVGSRVLVSKKGRDYRAEATSLLNRKRITMHEGDLIVDVRLVPPDRRRRDVDNSLKALLDSMQSGGAYLDDSQIVRLTVEKVAADPDDPHAEVVVQNVPAGIGESGFRTCLRCHVAFESAGPANRICKECTFVNNSLPGLLPAERGRRRRNGDDLV